MTTFESDVAKTYAARIMGLLADRDEINLDIKEVYDDAKKDGFDPKYLRTVIAEARLEDDVRNKRYETLDAYRHAIGLLYGTPLGEWASRQHDDQAPKRRRVRPHKSDNGHAEAVSVVAE